MLAKPGDILQDLWPYYFTSSPSPRLCSIKEMHPDPNKLLFWDASPPSSQTPGFLNEVTTPCLSTLSPNYWPVMQQAD